MSIAIGPHVLDDARHDHRSWQHQLARRRRRRPVALADWLLMDLQALHLRGKTQVPASFRNPLDDLVGVLAGFPEGLEHRGALEHPSSVAELIQALIAINATVTRDVT